MPKTSYVEEIATYLNAGYAYSPNLILPDPDPILRKLGRSEEIYREIRSDAKVAACIESRKSGCLSMQWDLTGSQENEIATQTIKEALWRLDMPRLISDILDAFLWGYQPLEVMWEKRDNLILPAKVVGKPPIWFAFDSANNLRFLSLDHPDGQELPERKFLLAQHHATFTNPYGEKILPKCFWPYTFKKGGWKWWVTAVEKFGIPFIIGKVPRGTDVKEREQLLGALDQLVQDAIAVLPNDSQVEILDGNSGKTSSSTSPHKDLIDQCNAEIALAIVGQTLSTEVGSTGSYAASKTHNEVREEIISGDKRMVERVLQQLVTWTYELNWQQGQPPLFGLYMPDDVDKVLAERDKILTETGIKFTKEYYVKAYGLSESDFEIASAAAESGPEFAAPTGKIIDPRDPDRYLPTESELLKMGSDIIEPLAELIRSGHSFVELQKKLAAHYPNIKADYLKEMLAKSIYLASVEGSLETRLNGGKI